MYILLYGMSGSGKSTIARELANTLKEFNISSTIISLDMFYKESYEGSFDTPDAFDWSRLEFTIHRLSHFHRVYLPKYCYETKQYIQSSNCIELKPAKVIIIEGIYSNYCDFIHNPYIIYINTPPDVCLGRRILRDKDERGISPEDNIRRWFDDVRIQWNRW
jgi:uridine kinase